MPDDHDYSADPPRRSRPRDDFEPDDRDDSYTVRTVPRLIRTAGIIWIIFGSLILINTVVNFALVGAAARENAAAGANAADGAKVIGGGCGSFVGIAFGIAFLFVGTQSVNGTAKDTLGNGIGSIVIGLLNAGLGAVALLGGLALFTAIAQKNAGPGADQAALIITITGGVGLLCGLGLILAGVLALMGRADYKAFRRAGKRSVPLD